jgi:hypothetical protein
VALDPKAEAAQIFYECQHLAFSGLSIEPIDSIEREYAKKIALKQIKFAERFMDPGKEVIVIETERGIPMTDGTVMTSQMRYLERLTEEIEKL